MQPIAAQHQNLAATVKVNALSEKIYLSPPDIGLEEQILVKQALESNWVAPEGPFIGKFEKMLGEYLGKEFVLALNSGTSAIHLGLKLLGIEPGDHVLVPTFSFCAAVNPVLYLNAIPVFVDCEEAVWGLDPQLLEEAIEDLIKQKKEPKAIIMVHSYGMPAKVNEIKELSRNYGIPVLEDAAESLGSLYENTCTGTFGDLSVLSFNGNKVLTTGGGGALILPDQESYDKALKWATQSKEAVPYYHHKELGFNYRISNVSAAIGSGQFSGLLQRIKNKQRIFRRYKEQLKLPGFTFFDNVGQYISNCWLSILQIDSDVCGLTNLQLSVELNQRNIESRPVWQPLHVQPFYEKYSSYISGTAEKLFSAGLHLPSGSALTDKQVDIIAHTIKAILGEK